MNEEKKRKMDMNLQRLQVYGRRKKEEKWIYTCSACRCMEVEKKKKNGYVPAAHAGVTFPSPAITVTLGHDSNCYDSNELR